MESRGEKEKTGEGTTLRHKSTDSAQKLSVRPVDLIFITVNHHLLMN
jgi:hypothetical protein